MTNTNKFRKLALAASIAGLCSFSGAAFSTASQIFTGINWSNPAFLGLTVKDYEVIAGGDWIFPGLQYDGTLFIPDPARPAAAVLPQPPFNVTFNDKYFDGKVNNKGTYNAPYARVAKRLNEQLLVAFELTTPFSVNDQWPDDTFAAYNAEQNSITTVNLSPIVVYNFGGKLKKLTLGAGPDFMYFSLRNDVIYPSLPVPPVLAPIPDFNYDTEFGDGPDVLITNHVRGWAYGWHVGLTYQAAKGTIIGATYFAQMWQNFTGTGTFTGFPNSENLSVKIGAPATTNVSLTQFFSKEWLVQAQVFYSQWSVNKEGVFMNAAGPQPEDGTPRISYVPVHYSNTWRYNLRTRYEVNPKWTVSATFAYDETPTNNEDRSLGLPESDIISLGAAVEYSITKHVAAAINYGHAWFAKDAPINQTNKNNGIVTKGSVSARAADAVGATLLIKG